MTFGRFGFKEITPKRIIKGFFRRIEDIPSSILWSSPISYVLENKRRILNMQGIYRTKRCFIMANGPSLAAMDLSPLADEITIGMNRIYLLFNKLNFIPLYYVSVNELVLEQFSLDINKLPMVKFLNWNQRKFFEMNKNDQIFLKLNSRISDAFSKDLTHPISSGGTVTYVALQIAYYLGFQEVILVGLDHDFHEKGIPNKIEVRESEQDTNHFHPQYFPKGVKWQLPDLRRSEISYRKARLAYEKDGRRILDATVNGKCKVFDKVCFESLF